MTGGSHMEGAARALPNADRIHRADANRVCRRHNKRFSFYKQPGCLALTRKICPKVKQLAKQPLRVKFKKHSSES